MVTVNSTNVSLPVCLLLLQQLGSDISELG